MSSIGCTLHKMVSKKVLWIKFLRFPTIHLKIEINRTQSQQFFYMAMGENLEFNNMI